MTQPHVIGSPWRALSHRNFALFFAGHGLSLCGTWMQSMAQAWLIYRLTGSPFLLGLAEFLARGPLLAFGLVGGLLADRWPRYHLMFVTQTLLLCHAGALAVLTLSGAITVEWIMGLAFFQGVISILEVPVRQSFFTSLVPHADIPSAIGLNSSLFNSARIIGPSIAGVLVGTVGEGVCFLLNAVSFLVVLGCLAAMRIDAEERRAGQDAVALLKEGLRYAWHTPHVRSVLALAALLSVAAMPFSTLLPVFAGDVLKSGPDGLGLLMAATGIGALAGALRLARRQTVRGLGASIAKATALFGGSLIALAASSNLWLSMLALAAVGFGMVSALAACNTLLQSLAPDPLRGRVVSLYATASLGFTIFGSLLAGSAATYIGAPLAVAAGGGVTLVGAVWFWKQLPAIRKHVREAGLLPPEPVVTQ